MWGASREGFPAALPGLDFEEEEEYDIKVGENSEKKAAHSNAASNDIKEAEVEGSATAGQL